MASTENELEPRVEFMNVDVELRGRCDWEELLRALGDSVFVLHEGEELLTFQSSKMGISTPEDAIIELLRVVDALPAEARTVWNAAASRVFDVGIQGGLEPWVNQWTLRASTITAIASLGADLTWTVYGTKLAAKRGS